MREDTGGIAVALYRGINLIVVIHARLVEVTILSADQGLQPSGRATRRALHGRPGAAGRALHGRTSSVERRSRLGGRGLRGVRHGSADGGQHGIIAQRFLCVGARHQCSPLGGVDGGRRQLSEMLHEPLGLSPQRHEGHARRK